jgi:hypothetical protein
MDGAAAPTATWGRAMCNPFRWFRTRGSRQLLSPFGRRGQFGKGFVRSNGESNLSPCFTNRPYSCLTSRPTAATCASTGNRDADRCPARNCAAQHAAGIRGGLCSGDDRRVATGDIAYSGVDRAGTFVGASSGSADRSDTPKIGVSIDLPFPSALPCTDAAAGSKAASGSVTRASLIPCRRGTGRRWRAHYNAGDRPQP